jgi:group I intron endonuclease
MAYLYIHKKSTTNEIFYVGIGTSKNYKRAYNKQGRNSIWNNIVSKHKFTVNVLLDGLTWEEACFIETEMIGKYGRLNNNTGVLCNMTDGGEGANGAIRTIEQRFKISQSLKGERSPNYGKSITDSAKKKISIANSGINNGMYGVVHTEEYKKAMSELLKGTRTGKDNPMYGRRAPNAKYIIDMSTGFIFDSLKEASLSLNMADMTLSKMLRGISKNKTTYKYV